MTVKTQNTYLYNTFPEHLNLLYLDPNDINRIKGDLEHLQETDIETCQKMESHESPPLVFAGWGKVIVSAVHDSAWLSWPSWPAPGAWWRQRAGSLWSLQQLGGPGPADINQTPARPPTLSNSVIWQEIIVCFQMSKVDKIFALQNTYNFLLLVNFLGQG